MKGIKGVKKLFAVLMALVIMLSMTACGDTSWIINVDGEIVNSGLYIYYQSQGYTAAGYELAAEDQNYYYYMMYGLSYIDDSIGDQTVKDYMNEYALNMCEQYVVVERLFDQLGLELTEDDEALIDAQVNNLWNQSSDALEKAGISKATVKKAATSTLKEEMVFNAYYEVGGLNGTTEEDIQGFLEDNYARIKYMTFPYADDVNDAVDQDRLNEALDMANAYLERAEAGEEMDDLIAEYDEILAEQEATEEVENEETTSDETTTDETTTDETTTDETTDEEENVKEDLPEIDAEEEEEYPNEVILYIEDTTPSEKFVNYVFEDVKTGTFDLVQDDLNIYLVQKLDILERDDIYEDNRETFLYALFDSDYTALINNTLADYSVVVNDNSVKRYKPERAIGME